MDHVLCDLVIDLVEARLLLLGDAIFTEVEVGLGLGLEPPNGGDDAGGALCKVIVTLSHSMLTSHLS